MCTDGFSANVELLLHFDKNSTYTKYVHRTSYDMALILFFLSTER